MIHEPLAIVAGERGAFQAIREDADHGAFGAQSARRYSAINPLGAANAVSRPMFSV